LVFSPPDIGPSMLAMPAADATLSAVDLLRQYTGRRLALDAVTTPLPRTLDKPRRPPATRRGAYPQGRGASARPLLWDRKLRRFDRRLPRAAPISRTRVGDEARHPLRRDCDLWRMARALASAPPICMRAGAIPSHHRAVVTAFWTVGWQEAALSAGRGLPTNAGSLLALEAVCHPDGSPRRSGGPSLHDLGSNHCDQDPPSPLLRSG